MLRAFPSPCWGPWGEKAQQDRIGFGHVPLAPSVGFVPVAMLQLGKKGGIWRHLDHFLLVSSMDEVLADDQGAGGGLGYNRDGFGSLFWLLSH